MLDVDIFGPLAEAVWLDHEKNCRMSETHRRALYWLVLHSDTNGHSDLSPASLAQHLGISHPTANKLCKELRNAGLVTFLKIVPSASEYRCELNIERIGALT